jgi:hypothetical protein
LVQFGGPHNPAIGYATLVSSDRAFRYVSGLAVDDWTA